MGLNHLGEQYRQYRLIIKQAAVFIQFVVLLLGGFWAISEDSSSISRWFVVIYRIDCCWCFLGCERSVRILDAGITLLLDRPFQVGDRISFDGHYGEVVEIGLRTVRVLDLEIIDFYPQQSISSVCGLVRKFWSPESECVCFIFI